MMMIRSAAPRKRMRAKRISLVSRFLFEMMLMNSLMVDSSPSASSIWLSMFSMTLRCPYSSTTVSLVTVLASFKVLWMVFTCSLSFNASSRFSYLSFYSSFIASLLLERYWKSYFCLSCSSTASRELNTDFFCCL